MKTVSIALAVVVGSQVSQSSSSHSSQSSDYSSVLSNLRSAKRSYLEALNEFGSWQNSASEKLETDISRIDLSMFSEKDSFENEEDYLKRLRKARASYEWRNWESAYDALDKIAGASKKSLLSIAGASYFSSNCSVLLGNYNAEKESLPISFRAPLDEEDKIEFEYKIPRHVARSFVGNIHSAEKLAMLKVSSDFNGLSQSGVRIRDLSTNYLLSQPFYRLILPDNSDLQYSNCISSSIEGRYVYFDRNNRDKGWIIDTLESGSSAPLSITCHGELAVDPLGRYFACGDSGRVKIYAQSGTSSDPIAEFVSSSTRPSVAFSPDGAYLAVGSRGTTRVFLSGNWTEVRRVHYQLPSQVYKWAVGDDQVRFIGSNEIVVLPRSEEDRFTRDVVWPLLKFDLSRDLAPARSILLDSSPVSAMVVSSDSRYIAIASSRSRARLVSTRDGRLVREFVVPRTIRALALSPDSRFLAIAVGDKPGTYQYGCSILAFDLVTGAQVYSKQGLSVVREMLFTWSGQTLIASYDGGKSNSWFDASRWKDLPMVMIDDWPKAEAGTLKEPENSSESLDVPANVDPLIAKYSTRPDLTWKVWCSECHKTIPQNGYPLHSTTSQIT